MQGLDTENRAEVKAPEKVGICNTLASALGSVGGLWRLLLAFVLWFFTAAIPWVNLGTTLGLFAIACDIARKRPVSPIEIFDSSHRAKIVPALGLFGLTAAGIAGTAIIGALVAFHAGLLFAAFPGWTIRGAALPCPCLAATPWQRLVAVAVAACGLVPALALSASWAFALPISLETGKTGVDALRASRELVGPDLLRVVALLLLPAVIALAAARILLGCGASVATVFLAEAVAAVFGIAVYGRTYGALLEARSSGAAGKEA